MSTLRPALHEPGDRRLYVVHSDTQMVEAVRQHGRHGVRLIAGAVSPDAQITIAPVSIWRRARS